MFIYQLTRRLEGTGVTATAAHPSAVTTSFSTEDHAAHLDIMIRAGAARVYRSPDTGQVWAERVGNPTGNLMSKNGCYTGKSARSASRRGPVNWTRATPMISPRGQEAMADPLTLINAFEVPREDAERFIAAWEKTRDYLRSQPGYVDTALHQAVTPNADFQFVNIGRWQTIEDFQAATQSPGFRESAAGLTGYRPHPGLYRVVRT